jgi:hypothetical protein
VPPGDGDPKTFIVDDLEFVTLKRAGELRRVVRVREIMTGTVISGEQFRMRHGALQQSASTASGEMAGMWLARC